MIKFYTPRNWMTVFDAPSIIIEDDGLIYTENEYYKLSKTACGRVDTKTGYIYGKGHYSKLTAPIGAIKQGHNCIEIYGDDFASIMAVPIYYVQGDTVYSAEEYDKVFGQAAGYIKRDDSTSNKEKFNESLGGEVFVGNGASKGRKDDAGSGCLSVIWNVIKTTVIILGLLVLSGWIWNEMYFTEDGYMREFICNIICLLIGLLAAIFKKDENTSSFTVIFWVSTILFGLYMGIGIFIESGFGFKSVLFSILGMFLAALYCLTPSVLLSLVVGLVKMTIYEIRNRKGNKK